MRRLFKYPPVEDVYLFVEKARYFAEVPNSVAAPVQQTTPPSTHSTEPSTPATHSPIKEKFLEVKHLLNKSNSAPDDSERIKQLEAKVADLKSTQKHMAHRLERLIYSLQKDVMENNAQSQTFQLSNDSVLLTLAELKHIKDILMGLLPSNNEDD
jgi:hypothetical protein